MLSLDEFVVMPPSAHVPRFVNIEEAVQAERARCLKIAEGFLHDMGRPVIPVDLLDYYIANVIRAIEPDRGRVGVPAEPEPDSPMPIEVVLDESGSKVRVRTYHALKANGIDTVTELRSRTKEQLLALHQFGPAMLQEVEGALREYGWSLAENNSHFDEHGRV